MGEFAPAIGIGVYGLELQKPAPFQSRGAKYTLLDLKIRAPTAYRIETGISHVGRGAEDGGNGTDESIMMGDCYPTGARSFGRHTLSGRKIEDHGKQPHAVYMCEKMERLKSRMYAAA